MDKFNHRVFFPTGRQRVYWNGAAAGTAENATRVVVQVGPDHYCLGLEFFWPTQKHLVEKMENILDGAHERGREAAKKEIRDVLGVVEPRR